MKVGDLVRDFGDGDIGIIVSEVRSYPAPDATNTLWSLGLLITMSLCKWICWLLRMVGWRL